MAPQNSAALSSVRLFTSVPLRFSWADDWRNRVPQAGRAPDLTDRDIAIRAIAKGKDPNKTTLRDVMTKGIHYCYESDSLEKVTEQMERLQIRRLVVLNDKEHKRMTGIISLGDIATKASNPKLSSELADAVSHH